ncbi:MAG: hypothetical protein ACHQ1H_04120, partial [Nitrososphaerales archaeon]
MSAKMKRRVAVSFLPIIVMVILVGVYLNSALSNTVTSTTITMSESLTSFVNPFIGTGANGNYGGGDTFPGAAYP